MESIFKTEVISRQIIKKQLHKVTLFWDDEDIHVQDRADCIQANS